MTDATSTPPVVEITSGNGDHPPVAASDHMADNARRQQFFDGLKSIRAGGGGLNLNERVFMVLGGVIAPLGLVLVLLGWYGAARTPNSFEQIPYLISGGLFGLALVFLGAFFYFTHWLTELVKESRGQSAALLEAVSRLEDRMNADRGPTEVIISDAAVTSSDLVATTRGSMAHRPDCAVVNGKKDLRPVTEDDGLLPCKMCNPYS